MRVVQGAGVLVACAALAASCGSSHHTTLVLKAEKLANVHELGQAAAVVRRRLALLGVQDATVSAGPHGRITVTTRQALAPQQRRVLTQRGSFAIYDLEADLAPESMRGYSVRASPRELQPGPETTVVRCDLGRGCPGASAGTGKTYWYVFQSYPGRNAEPIPELTERDLRRSGIHSASGGAVALAFTPAGDRRFREITQTESARGQALSAPQHFAIVLDQTLLSTPYVDYKQYPNGIDPSGTGAEISSIPSASEADRLAILLRSGALPVRLVARPATS